MRDREYRFLVLQCYLAGPAWLRAALSARPGAAAGAGAGKYNGLRTCHGSLCGLVIGRATGNGDSPPLSKQGERAGYPVQQPEFPGEV